MNRIRPFYCFCFLLLFHIAQGQPALLFPAEITFSPQGGFYNEELEVELSHSSENVEIRYTLDGSEPNSSSSLYQEKIKIEKTQVIRATAFQVGKPVCRIESSTYFIQEPLTDWLVVSLAIPPQLLFDTITGLFQEGLHKKITGTGNYGANYWDRKEYPLNVEIFESDSSCVYQSPSGFKIFGGVSRKFPQKSLALSSRLRYGNKRFKHRFFSSTSIRKFKHLVLRNAGSDWNKAHGRDVIIGKIVEDWDLDKQAARPCHVYLNGKYWGIYYLREKMNAHFIAAHHKEVARDTIDLIENRWALRKGTKDGYLAMLQFIEKSNFSTSKNYNFLQTLMNVENYTDYKILQIFIDNVDAGGNIKFWRADSYDNGRWNWLLYDTDWGMGLMKRNAFQHNSFDFHLIEEGEEWPNPAWSTLILRKLMQNKSFRKMFVNRFCDRLNTSLRTDSMLSVIQQHQILLEKEMPRQFERWKNSEKNWKVHYARMKAFARYRPNIIRQQLQQRFQTGESVPVSIQAEGRGAVWINNNIKCSYKRPFKGHYFQHIPITLYAKPRLGYKFSHWEGTNKKSPVLSLDLSDKKQKNIKAIFLPLTTNLRDSIVFNEVSVYNKQTGDWIEIHNTTKSNIFVKDWVIKSKKKEFKIPAYWLGAEDYLVIARDTTRFLAVFPHHQSKVIGNFNFGLHRSSDRLELYTERGAIVDTFTYHIETPRSDFTIDLKSPFLDNAENENWEVKYGRGTPADINPSYWYEIMNGERNRYILLGLGLGLILCLILAFFKMKY